MIIKEDSKILIVGLGRRTGLEACNFLANEGHNVWASDIKSTNELQDIIDSLDNRVTVIAGNQSPEILDQNFDFIVISPGVSVGIPLIQSAVKKGVPVISEIELAYNYMQGLIVAITGTDGKSTTTSLVGHVLKSLGINTIVGGNIGIPLISLISESDEDTISVVEMSSFQLETIESFKPDVSAILNVGQDHLDRYDSIDDYFSAKLRISMNQDSSDYYIYNLNDKIITARLGDIRSQKLCFSINRDIADAFYKDGFIFLKLEDGIKKFLDVEKLQIIGVHNIENTMAALLMILSILNKKGIDPNYKQIEESCYSFKGLVHRMESIGEYEGRHFINDSKATTVGAVEMALKSLKNQGILILGGRTKGDDYSRLNSIMREKVKHLVLIGESTDEFSGLFKEIPYSTAKSMDEAAVMAMGASSEGDVIILSPACASFDMFNNFEERGNAFKNSISKLNKGELVWTSNQ